MTGPDVAPTIAAARARIAAIDPDAYARTRNAIDGSVSGLSPWITHGFVTSAEVLAAVNARHPLTARHKFVFELGWRAYFRHVWMHRGAAILCALHEGPLPANAYSGAVPIDVRRAATGIPAIDTAVRTLYATGLLHNHARMWLASYLVHLRKVHWRAGADWMIGHLLDGDLASNHLSWQWVAGTGSHKPYLFNAANVAQFAPVAWQSAGTAIDTDYATLERIARDPTAIAHGDDGGAGATTQEPPRTAAPPADLGFTAPDAASVDGADVWLVHPWRLADLPARVADVGTRVVGICVADFHHAWPWTERRWRFVGQRMATLAPTRWYADADAIGRALARARSVRSIAEPHLAPWLDRWAACEAPSGLFPEVARPCDSFSQWWTRATCGFTTAADLLTRPAPAV
jgi:deoxyribodipyrimidine photo-lyase